MDKDRTPSREPGLDAAYSLRTPDDSRRLYRLWAARYDSGFAAAQGYLLPGHVAAAYAGAGGVGPVLDVGAGTGLVGAALAARGIAPIEGTDISPEMLAVAAGKGHYARLFASDVTRGLDITDGHYAGVVSAGTFTLGHLGPEVLAELVRIARPGALFVLSVHTRHFDQADFAGAFAALDATITPPDLTAVAIYGEGADPAHRDDRAHLAVFVRR